MYNSGHLQTMYCVLHDFSEIDQVWYYRQHLNLMDGGTLYGVFIFYELNFRRVFFLFMKGP